MKTYSLYKHFFIFLDRIAPRRPKWPAHYSTYYKAHRDFFEAYFSIFPSLDKENLKGRVERIKKGDCSGLRNLLAVSPPETIVERACQRCLKVTAREEQPEVYLFHDKKLVFLLRLLRRRNKYSCADSSLSRRWE